MNLDPFGDPFKLGAGLSSSDIFRRPRSGAISRPKKAEPAPEPESETQPLDSEAMDEETAAAEENEQPGEKVVLKNPKWEVEEVGFNEETEISVEAELPESQAHKTKVSFELFAKTPDGPESISKCEGTIQDGKATGKIPVYIPQYKDAEGNLLPKVEYYFTAKHSASDLLKDESVVKSVDHLADRLIQSHILQDVTFATGKSFISPGHSASLKSMVKRIKEWKKEHPDAKLAIFGHADAVGKEGANKKLSERRADSVFAFLTKDPDIWKALYDEEKWGLATTQELLKYLGHDPGTIDGQDGPKTQGAVKSFQGQKGMTQSGQADAATREALYDAFFAACNSEAFVGKDFDAIDGKPRAGCSEFNLVEQTQGACEKNRRVAVFLLKSNKNFPIQYPCKHGDVEPCKKQVARKGARRTAGFQCLFYDQLVVEAVTPPPEPEKAIVELKWEKQVLIVDNASADADRQTKVLVKTAEMPGAVDAVLEFFQYAADGKHESIAKHDLKLEGDKLFTKDGKEFACRIAAHKTLYDHGRHQYFCTLKAEGQEKSSPKDKAGLLHLKHLDSCVADPSGDLPGAAQEGTWFNDHISKHGPWKEATENKAVADGHKSDKKGAVTTAEMKALLEGDRFLHHQSSHGTAYCTCDGKKNYVKKTANKGADGYLDYACPVCGKYDKAIGTIFLKGWSDLFFIEDVKALKKWPKTLLFANCCLTSITDTYPKAWNAQGTRWYIGWALPVGDADAVNCAKAFYKRWLEHYEMDPAKVQDAFNDIKGPYAKYRPRISGA